MVHDPNRDQRLAGISAANRKNDLQIVPAPPGFEYDYYFFPGANAYGVIDAGYECPKCKTPVNGMGTKPFVHRFDYRHCLMALRHPDSNWNASLTELRMWESCTQAAIDACKAQGLITNSN